MSKSPSASKLTAEQYVNSGLIHHQAGRLDKANEDYQQALSLNPDHPDALHLLGMLAHQVGDNELAVDLINLAIHGSPTFPNYHCNLGTVLQAQGKLEAAVESFKQALKLDAKNAHYYYNLGRALQAQGNLIAAVSSYRQALSLTPDHVETLSNLAHTLRTLGQLDEAVDLFMRASVVAPQLAEIHFNLGSALNEQGKLTGAIESYQTATLLFPAYAQAHCNLGAALLAKGKIDEAIERYQHCLTINPNFTEAHYNLGIAYQAQDKLEQAIDSFRRALSLQPSFVEGHCNLGNALRAQGKLAEAIVCYEKALTLKPDYANAYSNLLFLHAYHATLPPEEYLKLAKGWEDACIPAQVRQLASVKTFMRLPLTARKLKVAYVSGDFRKHATSYFIEQLFAQHDRSKVELYAYSNNRTRDDITERINSLVDHWTVIAGKSDDEVCNTITADGIDVLIDLSGHSANNRLSVFARRAAPVQVSYLYFASTGLSEMDYWIGDEILTPPELDDQFSEKVWRLPRTWLAYQTITAAPAPQWQVKDNICLGCFNNLGKITPQTLQLWAKILRAHPDATLLLKNKDLADESNRQRILSELAALGIEASRIELLVGSPWIDYMAQHDRLDIALDPIAGHGGGTSTCDALWMGVPVIHLKGDHVGSRFAASILNAIGHPEWIADTEDDYLDKTLALAKNVALRKQLQATQRDTMSHSQLCNARDLAQTLEAVYTKMFQQWQETKME
jgi:predicted O-linked N-acetylglucosamine transferase (SPINDLY family)